MHRCNVITGEHDRITSIYTLLLDFQTKSRQKNNLTVIKIYYDQLIKFIKIISRIHLDSFIKKSELKIFKI